MNKVYVVLPVFNRLNYTKQCLTSLSRQSYRKIDVVLIDDGSTDGTHEYVRKRFPRVKVIEGDGNWWWTRSVYEGVELVRRISDDSDWILMMNNDCYFGRDYVSQLISTSRKYPFAVVGSMCVRASGKCDVVEAGIRIHWPSGVVYGVAQTISNKLEYYKNMEVVRDLDALPCKGTLIPIRVFDRVGNFDYKRLPHYIADYEFMNRAKRNGFDLLVDTRAIVKHHWEATGIYSRSNNIQRSYSEAINLLFGRKSMNNIVDWVNFLFLACPREYLSRNLWYSVCKLASGIFSVFPLFYFKAPYRYATRKYAALKEVLHDLVYVTKVKIVQFPSVYLRRASTTSRGLRRSGWQRGKKRTLQLNRT